MKKLFGFTFWPTNHMGRFISASRATSRAVCTSIAKGLSTDTQKNTASKCSFGVAIFQPRSKPSLLKRKSKNGNAFGKSNLLKKITPNGQTSITILTDPRSRHSAKFSLRASRAKENLCGIRFGFLSNNKKQQIGFRINPHFCKQEQKSKFSGMTIFLNKPQYRKQAKAA